MTALRAIHAGCRLLDYDEDMRRDLYRTITGKSSAAAMSEGERAAVVAELRRRGFRPAWKGSRKPLEGPYAKKLQALWIAGWNLGLIRNRDDRALLAFVRRQTGVDHTRFLHHQQDAAMAIEALKAWLARDGGVGWSVDRHAPEWTQRKGYRIAVAQFSKVDHAMPGEFLGLSHWMIRAGFPPADRIGDEAGWIPVMNALGERIRRVG